MMTLVPRGTGDALELDVRTATRRQDETRARALAALRRFRERTRRELERVELDYAAADRELA
jgi:hypothetical protein